jgi:hypothetical protein
MRRVLALLGSQGARYAMRRSKSKMRRSKSKGTGAVIGALVGFLSLIMYGVIGEDAACLGAPFALLMDMIQFCFPSFTPSLDPGFFFILFLFYPVFGAILGDLIERLARR